MENSRTETTSSIVACATITNKAENQDSFLVLEQPFKAILLADGLGGHEYAKYAKRSSERAVNFFGKGIPETGCQLSAPLLEELFRLAKADMLVYAKELGLSPHPPGSDDLLGTTAITLFENEDTIFIGYTGNGAVWHIRSNLIEFLAVKHFPWNAVNLLNPHSVPQKGKEALYKLISNSEDAEECVPSIIEIKKDRQRGDIIMICTDGIYSADQQKIGKNEKGMWLQLDPLMLGFFDHLKAVLFNAELNSDSLTNAIIHFLHEHKSMLTDDATLGILVTGKAIEQLAMVTN